MAKFTLKISKCEQYKIFKVYFKSRSSTFCMKVLTSGVYPVIKESNLTLSQPAELYKMSSLHFQYWGFIKEGFAEIVHSYSNYVKKSVIVVCFSEKRDLVP